MKAFLDDNQYVFRDDADRKELQNYLDAWCRRQTGTTSYMVDYKYAIEVPDM